MDNGSAMGGLEKREGQSERGGEVELALRESERRYRVVSEMTSDYAVALHVEPDGSLVPDWWTDAFFRLTGYAPRELADKGGMVSIVHPDDEALYGRRLEALRRGESNTCEYRIVTRSGEIRWMRDHVRVVRDDEESTVTRWYVAAKDITAEKLAEEALRRSEERFRTLFDNANDAIWIRDLPGRLLEVNRVACERLGYSREELLQMSLSDLVAPEYREEVARGREELLRRGSAVFESGHLHRDGHVIPVEISNRAIEYDGAPAALAIIRDITERKRLERELVAAREAAEAAAAAKSEFLANMSHEIRTPMNAVVGMTGLLLDTALTPEQREYAEAVRGAADSLLSVINDILDYSKIDAGKLELEIIGLDLGATVEDVVDLLSLKASEKGLEFACLIDPDVPTRVRGDPGRLRQVLINLVGNAVKFTEEGEVVIRVRLEAQDGPRVTVRFEVTDTGVGIAPDQMHRLFKPFSQVDASTTRRHGGSGLGLVIAGTLVGLMGGRIGVESRAGVGSTFWFTIPFDLDQDSAAAPEVAPEALRGRRILAVDDNATNRLVLREQLRSWGCLPEEASSGEEALAKLREACASGDPFSIAILDMEMPGMDGTTLGRRIKEEPCGRDVILVMLTSRGRRGDARLAEEVGFAAYLTKPMRSSHLRDCLAQVLAAAPPDQATETSAPVRVGILPSSGGRRHRILVAEDNITNQRVAVRTLEKAGYRADPVANGWEVLAALEMVPYDLILMDVQMPEMDGFQAAEEIRRREVGTGKHVPIIAMTAHAMKGDRERCLAAGMDDYVSKPVQPGDLFALMEKWLHDVGNGNGGPS